MKKARTTLRETAIELLKQHRTPDAAAAPFSDLLVENEALRRAIALHYLQSLAPKEPSSRRRPGPHRRPGAMPSDRQKSANLAAEYAYTHEIFARKLRGGKILGEIHVHELRAIAKSAAEMATRFFNRGYEDAVDLFACTALANHCVAADPFALVRETIKPTVVVSIYEQARKTAAESIASNSERLTEELIDAAAEGFKPPVAPRPRGRPAAQRPAV